MEFWRNIWAALSAPLTVIEGKPVTPLGLLQIVLIVAIGMLATYLAVRTARRVLSARPEVTGPIREPIVHAVRIAGVLLTLYVALTSVGFNLGIVLALVGGLSVGIGFGMQQIANNLVSGVIVIGERQIRVGTEIEVRGYRGRVERIAVRSVHVRLGDGQRVILASSILLGDPVKIYDQRGAVLDEAPA